MVLQLHLITRDTAPGCATPLLGVPIQPRSCIFPVFNRRKHLPRPGAPRTPSTEGAGGPAVTLRVLRWEERRRQQPDPGAEIVAARPARGADRALGHGDVGV